MPVSTSAARCATGNSLKCFEQRVEISWPGCGRVGAPACGFVFALGVTEQRHTRKPNAPHERPGAQLPRNYRLRNAERWARIKNPAGCGWPVVWC